MWADSHSSLVRWIGGALAIMLGGLLISCVGYAVARAMATARSRGARSRSGGGSRDGHGWPPVRHVGADEERGGLVRIATLPFQRCAPKYGSVEVQMMDLGGGHVHTRYGLPEFGSPLK